MLRREAILDGDHAASNAMGKRAARQVVGPDASDHPAAAVKKYQDGRIGSAMRLEDSHAHLSDLGVLDPNVLAGTRQAGHSLFVQSPCLLRGLLFDRGNAESGLPFQVGCRLRVKSHGDTLLLSSNDRPGSRRIRLPDGRSRVTTRVSRGSCAVIPVFPGGRDGRRRRAVRCVLRRRMAGAGSRPWRRSPSTRSRPTPPLSSAPSPGSPWRTCRR